MSIYKVNQIPPFSFPKSENLEEDPNSSRVLSPIGGPSAEGANKTTTIGRNFKSIASGMCHQKNLLWKGIALTILGLGIYQLHRTYSYSSTPNNSSLPICPKELFLDSIPPICKDNDLMSLGGCTPFQEILAHPNMIRYMTLNDAHTLFLHDEENRLSQTLHLIPEDYAKSISSEKLKSIVEKISDDQLKSFDFEKTSETVINNLLRHSDLFTFSTKQLTDMIRNKKSLSEVDVIKLLIKELSYRKDFNWSVFSSQQLFDMICKLSSLYDRDQLLFISDSITHEQFISIIEEFPIDSYNKMNFKKHFDAISEDELKRLVLSEKRIYLLIDKIKEKIFIFSGKELSAIIKNVEGDDLKFISDNISNEQFKELDFEKIYDKFNKFIGGEFTRKKEMLALIPPRAIPSLGSYCCRQSYTCFLDYLSKDQIKQLDFKLFTESNINRILIYSNTGSPENLCSLLSDEQIVAISEINIASFVLQYIDKDKLDRLKVYERFNERVKQRKTNNKRPHSPA